MSKVCSKCKVEKDESEFYASPLTVDGLEYCCKECKKEYNKARKEYRRKFNEDNREFVESLKTDCIKCGEDRPWVIQFHHVDHNTKEFDVTQVGTRSRAAIWKEASKCICLCSNCHDEFHHFFGKQPADPVDALNKYLNEGF